MRHRIVLLIFTAIAAANLNVEASKEIRPSFTQEAIEIDGHLSEEVWSQTQVIDDFTQQSPNEGQPTTERTEVRMLYDTEKLYIGFECYDSEPEKIVANEMRRDGRLWQNDNVYIMLDTYGDKRQCFFFRTNALGALSDTAVTDGGENLNGSWDCIWEAAGQQHEKGWTVEIAIPFNQLRFKKKDSMIWGVNFGRNIQRTNETTQWIQVPRSQSWPGTYHPIYQGKLTGLQGIAAPSYFDVKPYLLGGLGRNLEDGDWQRTTERDLGLDMKYGITSNLTLDLTLNTDFAQVEADQEEVNLTRFSLYFPERRDFFLEGSGLFAFGAGIGDFGPPPLSVFYSRSIGIEDEREVRLLGGGKLTGKVGAYSVGALNMTTAASGEIPMTNFSVLRMQRDILSDSTVGFIFTNRQSDFSEDYHRNGGIDLFFRPHDQWRMRAMTVGSWSPDPEERDMAWYLSNNWRNKYFRVNASYLDIGPQFTSKMGFMHRRNIRSLMLDTDYEIQISRYGVREVGTGFAGSYLLDHDNNLIGWDARIGGNMLLDSDDGFSLNVQRSFDRVDESFSVGDAEIPAGDYEMNQVSLRGFTESSRPFAVFGRAEYGDYFHGNRVSFNIDSQWRMTYQLAIETRYQRNWINLPEIDLFTTNVVGTRISYALNTRFFTKLYAQWNDSAERVSANFLLNYIYRPGSDFYLVYDQAWDTSDGFHTHDWTVLSKFTYLFSL
ncbi:MAG: DUF5916 domain-containing protein [Candidatus Poribacteria bacterium]|nr:DUF5916 domain-containing protein [Candidatus Poribacteria bacterium]